MKWTSAGILTREPRVRVALRDHCLLLLDGHLAEDAHALLEVRREGARVVRIGPVRDGGEAEDAHGIDVVVRVEAGVRARKLQLRSPTLAPVEAVAAERARVARDEAGVPMSPSGVPSGRCASSAPVFSPSRSTAGFGFSISLLYGTTALGHSSFHAGSFLTRTRSCGVERTASPRILVDPAVVERLREPRADVDPVVVRGSARVDDEEVAARRGRGMRELLAAERGEAEPHYPVVVVISFASHEAVLRGPVHQADGAVVTEQQRRCDVTDGGTATIVGAPDREGADAARA